MQYPGETKWINYYFEKNVQGDVIAVYEKQGDGSSATRVLAARYRYDPYGNPTSITNGSGTKVSQTSNSIAAINPFRYRGYRYDGETGLYYLQSRYYDPVTCRFVNADGYASTGQGIVGSNMFAYCNNNPISYSDQTGDRAMGPSHMLVNDGGSSTRSGSTSSDSEATTITVAPSDPEPALGSSDEADKIAVGMCLAIGFVGEFYLTHLIGELGTYNELRSKVRAEAIGMGLQVHHLVEKRFLAVEGIGDMFASSGEMPCVILDKETHQIYTNEWRAQFPYGSNYGGMNASNIVQFCRTEYANCGVGGGNWLEFLSLWFN